MADGVMVIMVMVKMVKKRRKVMVTVMMVDDYGDVEDDSNEVVYIRTRVTRTVKMIMTW